MTMPADNPSALARLIAVHRGDLTDAELADGSGITAAQWRALTERPLLSHGQPWEPSEGIVRKVADRLGLDPDVVRQAVGTSLVDARALADLGN